MLLCTFSRTIYHASKISNLGASYICFQKLLLINSKVVDSRYQTNNSLLRLFSTKYQKTFMNRCLLLRNSHSQVEGVDSQKASTNQQKKLEKITSCDELKASGEKVKIYFETSKGERIECLACTDKNVMNASIDNDIAMHGNCNGEAICSICHVYIDEKYQEFMPKISDEEAEMLDMVPNVEENSRLSCQIIVRKELEGAVFKLPHYNEPWVVQDPHGN